MLSTDPADRLLHARGQSFPDLVAMRSGQLAALPDGVAHPRSGADVRALLDGVSGLTRLNRPGGKDRKPAQDRMRGYGRHLPR